MLLEYPVDNLKEKQTVEHFETLRRRRMNNLIRLQNEYVVILGFQRRKQKFCLNPNLFGKFEIKSQINP